MEGRSNLVSSPSDAMPNSKGNGSRATGRDTVPPTGDARQSDRPSATTTVAQPPGLDSSTLTLRAITDTRSSYDLDPFFTRFGSVSSAPLPESNSYQDRSCGFASTSMGGSLQLPAIREPSDNMSYFRNPMPSYLQDDHVEFSRPHESAERTGDNGETSEGQLGLDGLFDGGLGLDTIDMRSQQHGDRSDTVNKARGRDDYLIHSEEHRKKFLGASSSQVFVKWLDEESGGTNPSRKLKHGMSSAEELMLPGQVEACHHPLPPEPALETYISTYFKTFHILYPVVEETWLRALLHRIAGPQSGAQDFITPVLYLVISLGASMTPSSHQSSAVARTYFELAWKTLSVILGRPFRSSVQALLLLAIAMRTRSKDGLAWQMTGSAIRISQSLGLHRQSSGPEASLDARIWFAAISLDAIGSIESGRPVLLRKSDYSTSLASFETHGFVLGSVHQPVNVLKALAELCQEIAHIAQVLFPTNPPSNSEYEVEVLRHIGQSHMRLDCWIKTLPIEIRPGGERPISGPFFPFAAMLHMQYHQILITLHRLSLVDHPRLVQQNLSHPRLQGQPFRHFLEASETICTQSARSILSTLDACARMSTRNFHYWTLHSVGSAIFALSLHVCRHSSTWQARADLELLTQATRYVTKSFLEHGQHPQFVDLYEAVNEMVRQRVANPIPSDEALDGQHDQGKQYDHSQDVSALTMDQTISNIDELWATLFGLDGVAGNLIG